MLKRDPPAKKNVVLSPDERKKVVEFVSLLMKIDRRVNRKASVRSSNRNKKEGTKRRAKNRDSSFASYFQTLLKGLSFFITHLSLNSRCRFGPKLQLLWLIQ